MNDPHVVALYYRIEHLSSVDYSRTEPTCHEEEGFSIRIEDGRVCLVMKEHYPTEAAAKDAVEPYLCSWELGAALTGRPGYFELKFDGSKREDRNPTPGKFEVDASPARYEFNVPPAAVTLYRSYPKPPVGVSLKRNCDVELMHSRYEDLCNDRDKLPSVAQFCLTMLERLAGGRTKAVEKFKVEREALNRVGELADKKGGRTMARKAKGTDLEFTPGETLFLENAVKVFIRRVAAEAHSPGGSFRRIKLDDFPELRS